ncbi:PspA/IM30 family protein [Phocaeicola abscessus]|uniref:PspA/IM30 family protein n=1 Tax=Phocaeicola abscessus TaxID=555313 RepID=UPI0003859D5A|nr:hypothetical protein [Phocaeicola abscessus]EPT32823.1 putative lipoprotein [Bacteroidetes bacterium oral taxon 272 str. F0290]
MKKKFLSAILFGAFLLASTGTFVSCKDYDDDIKDLQAQIDKKASAEELTSKVTALETSIASAKTEASEAKTKAQEALDAAGKAASGEDLTKLKKELQDQIDKLATVESVEKEIAALKAQIAAIGSGTTSEELKKLSTKVDTLTAKVSTIVGHRLTTLAVIPTAHINGIAAITLTSLQYTPQEYLAWPKHEVMYKHDHDSRPMLDHTGIAQAKEVYISTEKNKAYFHVSPNMGVRNQDITMPSFQSITSKNITRTDMTQLNTPIKPTAYNIDKNVLEVQYKKTVTGRISTKGSAHASGEETFTMVSLKTPIAKANLVEGEKEAYVNSEYVRVEELFKAPYIAHAKSTFKNNVNKFADEIEITSDPAIGKDGLFVHYHDSICAYESEVDRYVDIKADYNKELDLKKWVTVCVNDVDAADGHARHQRLDNYADYGLGYRFYLAKAPYITLGGPEGNSNKTDQQKFADVTKDGIMTSRVYTIDGGSATAVGREPIVRAELWDIVNNHLIAIRYIKVKWVKEVGETKLPVDFPASLYECIDYKNIIGTEMMNVYIYDKVKEGGMTKAEFHATYLDSGFDPNDAADWGKVKLLKNTEGDVESYNIEWTITHADLVKKYPNWEAWNNTKPMEFTKTFYWKSGTSNTLVITVTKKIYKPEFILWGYDGRYWRNNGEWNIFNVNPIVYKTQEANPAWAPNTKNNPTCNIYTDLLNGFLDDMGKKPTTGADGAIYFTVDRTLVNGTFTYKTGNKYYYAADYQNVPSGFKGVDRTKNHYLSYAKEGVRFVYDVDKLQKGAAYVYSYYDKATKTIKKLRATVKDNDTKEPKLYINNELAATIVNYEPNQLNAAELTYNIKLQEANPTHAPWAKDGDNVSFPTEAAKAIVGEYVPIKMVADLCNDMNTHPVAAKYAHLVVIKAYDAFIIEPLKHNNPKTDNFTDATIGGSTIDVKEANKYISWNADENGNYYPVVKPKVKNAPTNLAEELGDFYEAEDAIWDVENIKTNLKLVGGNLIPTDGVKDGPMPSNTKVVATPSNVNAEKLTYHNYSGTPVNWDYKMYIPVTYGYKWKTFVVYKEVLVKGNKGTYNPGK